MYRFTMVIILICLIVPVYCFAENCSIDFFALSKNTFSIAYEKRIKESSTAFNFSGSFGNQEIKENTSFRSETLVWDSSISGFHVGYRNYFNGEDTSGLFWGPTLGLSFVNTELTYVAGYQPNSYEYNYVTKSGSGLFFMATLQCGYKWVLPYGISLLLNTGIGHVTGNLVLGDVVKK